MSSFCLKPASHDSLLRTLQDLLCCTSLTEQEIRTVEYTIETCVAAWHFRRHGRAFTQRLAEILQRMARDSLLEKAIYKRNNITPALPRMLFGSARGRVSPWF